MASTTSLAGKGNSKNSKTSGPKDSHPGRLQEDHQLKTNDKHLDLHATLMGRKSFCNPDLNLRAEPTFPATGQTVSSGQVPLKVTSRNPAWGAEALCLWEATLTDEPQEQQGGRSRLPCPSAAPGAVKPLSRRLVGDDGQAISAAGPSPRTSRYPWTQHTRTCVANSPHRARPWRVWAKTCEVNSGFSLRMSVDRRAGPARATETDWTNRQSALPDAQGEEGTGKAGRNGQEGRLEAGRPGTTSVGMAR